MNTAALKRAKKLIDLLADEMDRTAPLHNVQAFLEVAVSSAEGNALEVKEIQQRLGMTSSALSRALGAIGEWSYTHKPGLDLVKAKMDYTDRRRKPMVLTDRRRKPMVLTDRGEKLAQRCAKTVE